MTTQIKKNQCINSMYSFYNLKAPFPQEGSAYASNSELETRLQARRPLPKTPPEPPHPPDSKDEQSNNHEEDDNVVGIGSGYVNSTFTATVADPPDAISVKSGADVNVLSEEGDWIVIFYNGKKGRVPRSYLCIEIFNDESIYEKIDDLSKQDSDTKIDGLELSDYYNAPGRNFSCSHRGSPRLLVNWQ
eukprot:m.14357 g.14357  ORF g.14357 m.14357 type:complete len:189 (+) comp25705_c0_seq3:1078-1644(+)